MLRYCHILGSMYVQILAWFLGGNSPYTNNKRNEHWWEDNLQTLSLNGRSWQSFDESFFIFSLSLFFFGTITKLAFKECAISHACASVGVLPSSFMALMWKLLWRNQNQYPWMMDIYMVAKRVSWLICIRA